MSRGIFILCYNGWYKWIVEEDIDTAFHKYIHKINIKKNILIDIKHKDKNKILVIKNVKDFDIFEKKYRGISNINWKKVSNDYGGIEICPYYLIERSGYIWYSTWEVASGCIWNVKSIIKNTELIYQKNKKNKYVKV